MPKGGGGYHGNATPEQLTDSAMQRVDRKVYWMESDAKRAEQGEKLRISRTFNELISAVVDLGEKLLDEGISNA